MFYFNLGLFCVFVRILMDFGVDLVDFELNFINNFWVILVVFWHLLSGFWTPREDERWLAEGLAP